MSMMGVDVKPDLEARRFAPDLLRHQGWGTGRGDEGRMERLGAKPVAEYRRNSSRSLVIGRLRIDPETFDRVAFLNRHAVPKKKHKQRHDNKKRTKRKVQRRKKKKTERTKNSPSKRCNTKHHKTKGSNTQSQRPSNTKQNHPN